MLSREIPYMQIKIETMIARQNILSGKGWVGGTKFLLVKPASVNKITEPTSNPTRLELVGLAENIHSTCKFTNKSIQGQMLLQTSSNSKDTSYAGSNAQQRIGLECFLIQRE